jgi:hypothetical protein
MLAIEKPSVIGEIKINRRNQIIHPFERFVTAEAVALMFQLQPREISRIECWRYIVYVCGKGVSRFVSYADFPPTEAIERLEARDFKRWEYRWYRRSKRRRVPDFWVKYYYYQLQKIISIEQLEELWQTIDLFRGRWTEIAEQQLQEGYQKMLDRHLSLLNSSLVS